MRRIVSVALPSWAIERTIARAKSKSAADAPSLERDRRADRHSQDAILAAGDGPVALVEGGVRGIRIMAVNPTAMRLGIAPGDGLADARAILPGLASAPSEPNADRADLKRLAGWIGRYGINRNAYGFTTEAPSGVGLRNYGLWVDITGVAHLYGGEEPLVRDLARRLKVFGFDARIGLADTFGAAHALAWYGGRAIAVAPTGETGAAIAPLSVAGLRLDQDRVRSLRRLGLQTIGSLMALPRVALERRFRSRRAGERVLMRLDQALGTRGEPRRPLEDPPALRVEALFQEPLVSAEVLANEVALLVVRLCQQLDTARIGVRVLQVMIYRSDGTLAKVVVGTSAPSRDARHLTRLIEEKTATLDLGLGADMLVLEATRVDPVVVEQGVLMARGREAAATVSVGVLVDRLVNRLGAARVVRIVPAASHWPERAEVRRPAIEGALAAADRTEADLAKAPVSASPLRDGAPQQPPRPALLFARPEPIAVMAEVPEGAPLRFTWRRVQHRVVRSEGPERIEPEWWGLIGREPTAIERCRDYYRIEDAAGGRFWVFRAGRYGVAAEIGDAPTWFVHGVFA